MSEIQLDWRGSIGRGPDGSVTVHGSFKQHNVAVKLIEKSRLRVSDHFEIIRAGCHSNLIRLLHIEHDQRFTYLVMELASCNLKGYMAGEYQGPAISNTSLLRQVSEGLSYIHSMSGLHRNIKPTNILILHNISSNNPTTVKLSEFGYDTYSHESWNVVGQRNNEGWVAPEMMQNGIGFPFSAAGDIFALGCIFFLMVTRGDHPFGSLDFSRDHRAIKGDYELAPLIRLNQPLITDFVLKMIDTLPQRRPTIDCILADNKFWTVLYRSDTSLHELKQQPNFADAMDSFTSEQYIPK